MGSPPTPLLLMLLLPSPPTPLLPMLLLPSPPTPLLPMLLLPSQPTPLLPMLLLPSPLRRSHCPLPHRYQLQEPQPLHRREQRCVRTQVHCQERRCPAHCQARG